MGQSGFECGKIISWQTGRTESSRLKFIKYLTSFSELFTVFTKTLNHVLFTQEISQTIFQSYCGVHQMKTYHLLFSAFFLMI